MNGTQFTRVSEGCRLTPYLCPAGKWTIGIGHNLVNPIPREALDLIFENLDTPVPTTGHGVVSILFAVLATPIPQQAAEIIFSHDYAIAERDAAAFVGGAWTKLDRVRQEVVIDMAFNMGLGRLQGFKRFRAALHQGDYETAAFEMLDSEYARKDVPVRASKLAKVMRDGKWSKA